MNTSMHDKVALVTGGGSGIGRATAIEFARRGAAVMIANRTAGTGNETVRIIREAGGLAAFVPTDIARSEDVRRMVEATVETFGRLDYACNSAATVEGGLAGPLADVTEEEFDHHMSVNLRGAWLCMKYQIMRMLEEGGGSIVNVSSVNGLGGTPGSSPYSAAKHAMIGLTKSAAIEYAKANIRINVLCAGAFRTPMLEGVFEKVSPGAPEEAEKSYAGMIPMGRIAAPEEAARTIVWLCSDDASYITGHSMIADGGLTSPFR